MASYEGLRNVAAEELLFQEGEEGTQAYLLIEGNVKLYRGGEDAPVFQHIFQGRAKAPQLIGKAALLGEKYQVSARTMSGVKLVPIPRASFAHLMDKADPLLKMMLTAMLQDLVLVYQDRQSPPNGSNET